MPRALDLLSEHRHDELKTLAYDAFREGGHLAVHRALTAEFSGDDWQEELELLHGTEHFPWEDQAFYRRLVSSRLFTMAEKDLIIDAHPLSDQMLTNLEILMRQERGVLKLILGEILHDVDQNTIGTLTTAAP